MRHKTIFLALFVILLLLCERASSRANQAQVAPPPPADASALQLEETADSLRAGKHFSQALTYLRAAIRLDTKNAILFNKCGIIEIQLNDTSAARKDLKRSLKLNPEYAEARNNMGVTYYLERNYKKAIKEYEKAIALRSDNASFYTNLGTALFARKKIDPAMQQYARALQIDPDALTRSGQVGISAQIASPEDRTHYYYAVAKLYAAQSNIDRSIEFLRKARELGYSRMNDVYKDPAFTAVRQDPRFSDLMMIEVGK